MIGGITSKGQGNHPRTTTGDKKVETGSPLTRDLITDCSPAYLKVQERFSPQKRPTLPPRKRDQEGKGKTPDSQRGEKKEKSTTPAEAPLLMINQEEVCTRNNISKSPTFKGREITFPPVTKGSNSSALIVIKAKIFGREVGWVHMDSGSSCKVIYEHCFLKLKPSIQASKVDSQVPLVGFSGEKSWAIREVLFEIMIGDAPLSRSETLNFVIVRSIYPYNMLLGRTSMQKIGMVVSTIQGSVKFYTTQGIKTVFSTHESDKIREGVKKIRETSLANT
ncbi:reverse transcriptase domain-containing protein [Tanacetum coccineum]